LSQIKHLTDGQTNRILITRPHLHFVHAVIKKSILVAYILSASMQPICSTCNVPTNRRNIHHHPALLWCSSWLWHKTQNYRLTYLLPAYIPSDDDNVQFTRFIIPPAPLPLSPPPRKLWMHLSIWHASHTLTGNCGLKLWLTKWYYQQCTSVTSTAIPRSSSGSP